MCLQFCGLDRIELCEGAAGGFAIDAPAAEAEAPALHMFGGGFDYEFRAKRLPRQVLATAPAALSAGHPLACAIRVSGFSRSFHG